MKNIVFLVIALVASGYLYSQVAKIRFLDGTIGYAVGQKLANSNLGDTLMFESLDQKVWRPIETERDPFLVSKQGCIQKIASTRKEFCAKVILVDSKKTELMDDYSLVLFSVGDTIQMIKRVDSEGEDIYRVYFGQLPGKNPETGQPVVIKKIFEMR